MLRTLINCNRLLSDHKRVGYIYTIASLYINSLCYYWIRYRRVLIMMNIDEEYEYEVDEDHPYFGEHIGTSDWYRRQLHQIKNNEDGVTSFSCNDSYNDVNIGERLIKRAWQLLGRYIANNTHLEKIFLADASLDDLKMALFFSELRMSSSLKTLDLDYNEFGIEGVRSVLPFLESSPQITILNFGHNNEINTECFELVVRSLHDKSIRELYFMNCNITDISSLETHNLPTLQRINLDSSNIGREGCITLSNLLRPEGSTLTELYLVNTGMAETKK